RGSEARGQEEGIRDHGAGARGRLDQADDRGHGRDSMKTIEIIVDAKGQSRVETKGFAGSECREASRFLEQALGVLAGEMLKPEYYQQQPGDQSLEQPT